MRLIKKKRKKKRNKSKPIYCDPELVNCCQSLVHLEITFHTEPNKSTKSPNVKVKENIDQTKQTNATLHSTLSESKARLSKGISGSCCRPLHLGSYKWKLKSECHCVSPENETSKCCEQMFGAVGTSLSDQNIKLREERYAR